MAGLASATIFATPLRYTACLTENPALSPWDSLAVSKGYASDDHVIPCTMVESPRLYCDDVSQEPQRRLTGLASSMTELCSWNMPARSDMVVAMGPQHAALCADAGLSRTAVHQRRCAMAGRPVRELKGGGHWRRERALAFPIRVDPDDEPCVIPAIKDPADLQRIVAGGWGPCTAICHGWSGGNRAVHGPYEV